ncbi:MAG: NAD(P)/FAD-dependent oxidoreductase, partial [Dichotomicrobium sp.]
GREVVVLEAADMIGTDMSSRNSEVIHAGIYYPAGSLKARLCVAGRHDLYAYCEARGVPHSRTEKLIVATEPEQVPLLDDLLARARKNGVEGVRRLDKEEATRMEPACRAEAALLSETSGIIDAHALMLSLQGEAEEAGAMIAFNTPFVAGDAGDNRIVVRAGGTALRARTLINSAGLAAVEVARRITGMPERALPPLQLAKGTYMALSGRAPFGRLIYPVPEPGGLGIHLTLDLGGQARFGPDVEWVDEIDYRPDDSRLDGFYAAIRRYWPDLPDGSLHPSYCGIRPKIGADPATFADFVIQGAETHGVAGLVNLFGIESPGLTSCLAIAAHVRDLTERT